MIVGLFVYILNFIKSSTGWREALTNCNWFIEARLGERESAKDQSPMATHSPLRSYEIIGDKSSSLLDLGSSSSSSSISGCWETARDEAMQTGDDFKILYHIHRTSTFSYRKKKVNLFIQIIWSSVPLWYFAPAFTMMFQSKTTTSVLISNACWLCLASEKITNCTHVSKSQSRVAWISSFYYQKTNSVGQKLSLEVRCVTSYRRLGCGQLAKKT